MGYLSWLWAVAALVVAGCASTLQDSTQEVQAPVETATPAQTAPIVGLLYPLTGPQAALGQSLSMATQKALFDNQADSLKLVFLDTQGTPEGARKAYNEGLKNGVQVFLGPVFASEVKGLGALKGAVPLLSFSTDESLAKPPVHTFGFSPRNQMAEVLSYAVQQQLTKIVAILPDDALGRLMAAALSKEATEKGVTLVQTLTYRPQQEFYDQLKTLKSTGFQALFLPLPASHVSELLSHMMYFDISLDQVRLLGVGLWDSPSAWQEQALMGAWYAAPAPQNRTKLEEILQKGYDHTPHRLASLAYDGLSLVATLVKEGTALTSQNLRRPGGFDGLDGPFRLDAQGRVERHLSLLEITPQGPRVLQQGKRSFS